MTSQTPPTPPTIASHAGDAGPAAAIIEKLIIIGSGPAGWTAGIYAARAKLDPLIYEGDPLSPSGMLPLGQLNLTTEVENYPGFPTGVVGPKLMEDMREQARHCGARIESLDIASVDLSRR